MLVIPDGSKRVWMNLLTRTRSGTPYCSEMLVMAAAVLISPEDEMGFTLPLDNPNWLVAKPHEFPVGVLKLRGGKPGPACLARPQLDKVFDHQNLLVIVALHVGAQGDAAVKGHQQLFPRLPPGP